MSAEVALETHEVCKTYGRRLALDHVSLRVVRGEMVALIGASGSGKSTLLRSLTGLERIDPGPGWISARGSTVQADGRLGEGLRDIRTGIGFVFQQFNLVPRLSLFANVLIGALGRMGPARGLIGRWSREEQLRAMAALARVGISDYAGQRANTLSGGQQQRGAIARTLVQGAEIVLADEPVASLDPVSARRVMDILQDLNRADGLTVVVTLHQVDHALRYCPRVVALAAGKLVYDGPSDGLDRDRLLRIYGPEFEAAGFEPPEAEGRKS